MGGQWSVDKPAEFGDRPGTESERGWTQQCEVGTWSGDRVVTEIRREGRHGETSTVFH